MTAQEKLDQIVEIAKGLGASVRYESMAGAGGGLCQLRNKLVLFVDMDCDAITSYEKVLVALADHFDLDAIYLRPQIRQDLADLRG
jgi:hypothetical protein